MTVYRVSGWHPDLPDPRDYSAGHELVEACLRELPPLSGRPAQVDWRSHCTPCTDCEELSPSGDWQASAERCAMQLRVGSVHACVELLEQFAFRVQGRQRILSRPFVHRTARRLAEAQGAPPLSLRAIWKAIRQFGVPTEELWPGVPQPGQRPPHRESGEPDAFAYSAARTYDRLRFVRLDGPEQTGVETLDTVRSFIAAGFYCVFGFPVATSASADGAIAYPTIFDSMRGGQAVLAVGYDDQFRVRSDRGCLLVRGPWGRQWGEEGYGWLPYTYVRKKLAIDFWTAFEPEWLESGEFQRPG